MAVWDASFPGRIVTRPEYHLAAILALHHFALEHVYQLVFVFVPVALR